MIWVAGKDRVPPTFDSYRPAWATIAGHETAYWAEPGETYYRQSPPEIGVDAPIQYGDFTSDSESAWLLHWSTEQYERGWTSRASVEDTCVVRALLRESPDGPTTPPHVATPLEVHRVADLARLPIAAATVDFWSDPFGRVFAESPGGLFYARLGPYHVFEYNFEGDVGTWLICREEGATMSALLCGYWDVGVRFFYAGHRVLGAAERAPLTQKALRPRRGQVSAP